MPLTRLPLIALAVGALVAGCDARRVEPLALAASAPTITAPRAAPLPSAGSCVGPARTASALAGRTLVVERIEDIVLRDREVVLTFDDGPRPKTTPAILDALDAAGVRATFLMVGQMARAYPQLVRTVAARGHTIGSHTDDHAKLTSLSRENAMATIVKGERAIAAALSGSGYAAAPFFRFPYLADSPSLRAALAARGTVVLDVDIDSRDFVRTAPAGVLSRTVSLLKARGRGIILFHDIHARTAAALPSFLAALKAEGYSVVHLVPPGATPCARPGS
jgi:peptidoglycan/xylan/chitin deacetylase (PgdA/CDA1 family)